MPRKKPLTIVPVHRFNIAIPQPLFEKIERMAAKNYRSTTAQIICALEWATEEEPDVDAEPKTQPVEHV